LGTFVGWIKTHLFSRRVGVLGKFFNIMRCLLHRKSHYFHSIKTLWNKALKLVFAEWVWGLKDLEREWVLRNTTAVEIRRLK